MSTLAQDYIRCLDPMLTTLASSQAESILRWTQRSDSYAAVGLQLCKCYLRLVLPIVGAMRLFRMQPAVAGRPLLAKYRSTLFNAGKRRDGVTGLL